MTETLYWIWFQLVFGIGGRRPELMLNYFGHPKDIFEGLDNGGKTREMLTDHERGRLPDAMRRAENILARTIKKGCVAVTPDMEEYPRLLREIYGRPAVLYAKGDLACLNTALCIAVVGPRKATEYGIAAAKHLSRGLTGAGAIIVSGLANGVDAVSHWAAVQGEGKTVGFLGCGIDVDYPSGSADLKRAICDSGGAVATEFPLGAEPRPMNFPLRNRIISGVSHGVVVAEAAFSSGALITADHALDQGRDVFVVPGSIFSDEHRGVHKLLKEGARPVESALDILAEYPNLVRPQEIEYTNAETGVTIEMKPPESAAREKPMKAGEKQLVPGGVSDEGRVLYDLFGPEPVSVEELAAASGAGAADLLATLTELEIFGLIQSFPGRMFGLYSQAT